MTGVLVLLSIAILGSAAYGVYWYINRELGYLHQHLSRNYRFLIEAEHKAQEQNRLIIQYQMDLLGISIPPEAYRSPDASDPWLMDGVRQEPISAPTHPSIHMMPAAWLQTVMKGDSNG